MGVIIPQVITEDKASSALVIDGSLKFDKNKSQRLQFTPSNSGNRRTWTISYWYKNTNFGNTGRQFQAGTSNPDFFLLGYHSLGYIQCTEWSTNWFRTGALLRDTGWYHIVLAWDSTQATNTERWRFYINGVRQNSWTDSGTDLNYPSQNAEQAVNKASVVHQLGSNTANSQYTDGHMAQVYFIDGQQLDPSYFGYTDALTNTWRPKKAKITLGSVWSNYFTGVGIIDDGSLANLFDGDTATAFEFNSTGGNGVFRPPNPIPYSTSVELFSSRTLGAGTVSVNGGSTVSYGGNAWVTVASGPGTLTSLTFYNGTAGNQRIHAIRIDGNILTNTSGAIDAGANGYYLPFDGNSPIGQDQSGRGNNWTPVNFGGTNTIEKATGALPILNTDGGGKVARVGVRTDSNASSLVLATPFVGIKSDFSNAINSGTSNKAVTVTGTVTFPTTRSIFYGSSLRTSSGNYLTASGGGSGGNFDFGSGDFTVECWANANSINASSAHIISAWFDSSNLSFAIAHGGGGAQNMLGAVTTFNGSQINLGFSATTVMSVDTWYHLVLVRNSNTVSFYINGILNASSSITGSITTPPSVLTIGTHSSSTSTYYFDGYIQDLRIYKGLAKYTQNFIPASTDPDILPDTPSGVAYSSNVALVPSTDGAVAFDGASDYLNLGSSADYNVGTGDFTFECFAYYNTRNDFSGIFGPYTYSNNGLLIQISNSSVLRLVNPSAIEVSGTTNISNRWVHIAVTRSGTTLRGFINGIQEISTTYSSSIDFANGGAAVLGVTDVFTYPGTYDFRGFISNVHFVKGTALYTSNFTPPTGPITSVANTKLLCCKSNSSATAYDVSPGTITANGNAAATNFNPFTVNINTQRGQESGYCTLNPLLGNYTATLSDGNLTATGGASNYNAAANTSVMLGKWYWEATSIAGGSSSNHLSGIVDLSAFTYGQPLDYSAYGYGYRNDAKKTNNNLASNYGSTYTVGDVIGVAFDGDAGTLTFYKNGISQGQAFSGISTTRSWTPGLFLRTSSDTISVNFGQKPFKFPPPAGFQPLALANTPRPTIVRPDQYVGIVTYTGTTANPVSIKSTNFTFTPDFVWVKSRSNGESHALYDTVRGATYRLRSDTTGAETTGANELQSFIPGGFTAGNNGHIYYDGYTYVAWCWKAGGNSNTFNINDIGYSTASAAGLTAGTITPTGASVNTKSGFSIIAYTGTGSAGSVPHGLGKEPYMIILKTRGVVDDWRVYHKFLDSVEPEDYYLMLQSTNARSADQGASFMNDTAPTSTTFSLGTDSAINGSTRTMIAYLWAEIPGFSKFGSYTGNSSSDGPVVVTGFRPRWILIKCSSSDQSGNAHWLLFDSERNKFNVSSNVILGNLSDREYTAADGVVGIDILSNGFKIRDNNTSRNGSGTFIFAAFAESPSFNLYGAQSNAR